MIIKAIKVSDKGQIALPKSIRDDAGIEQGDNLLICYRDGKIFLEKVEILSEAVEEDFSDLLKHSQEALKKIWENEQDERWSKNLARRQSPRELPVHKPARRKSKTGARHLK